LSFIVYDGCIVNRSVAPKEQTYNNEQNDVSEQGKYKLRPYVRQLEHIKFKYLLYN